MRLPDLLRAADILGPAGPFANLLESFESRAGQQEMAAAVAVAFEQGGVTLIEAGTGTGKSLAYLVPAALFALQNDRKVIISTNTINLQEQLLSKDIPLVRQALSVDLSACLVKGWHNYLCLLRLSSLSVEDLEDDLHTELVKIRTWATQTDEGDASELGQEPLIWEDVCAESDTCPRGQCPFYDKCFFFGARKQMESAHILVVNHHLLFADVAVRRAVGWDTNRSILPLAKHIILDEAHHAERVATDFMGDKVSEYGLSRFLRRLHNPRHTRRRGVLSLVSARANECLFEQRQVAAAEAVLHLAEQVVAPAVQQMAEVGQRSFAVAADWLGERSAARVRATELDRWREQVGGCLSAWADASSGLAQALKDLTREAAPIVAEDPLIARELEALRERSQAFATIASAMSVAEGDEEVYWVERSGQRNQISLVVTPLDVGPAIQEWMQQLESGILTSATLTVAGSFTFIKSRLGLSQAAARVSGELMLPSPFCYRRQVLVGVPIDLPDPRHPHYPEAISEAVGEVLRSSRGRALVLFTSHALLRKVAMDIAPLCAEEGWPLLVQGEEGRTRMLEAFRSGDSVLLGTDSFWEGVDVPGEALSCVIMTRLPFRVPDEPVAEARAEEMRRRGLDPFRDGSLPEAVLKFKQGFGRLIRTADDRGAVVVCDRRIADRYYGRYFFSSLPECEAISGSLEQVAAAVREWV